MPHWQSLAVFSAVAEEGSFSAAAKKLELTQPTVSFHIDNLERDFACPLFQRTARGVILTVYGETLLEYTRRINFQLVEAHHHLKAVMAGSSGKILLGASTIPEEYILPTLLAQFLRENPELTISVSGGDSQTILTGFKAGLYPIAIVGMHPGEGYPSLKLWQDELVLIAHPAASAAIGPKPALTDLLSFPLVVRSGSSGSLRSVHVALENRCIAPDKLRVVLEVAGNEALKAAVMNQVGFGFSSRWAIQQELAAGSLKIVPLPDLKIIRNFYAVCRQPLSPACLQRFWRFLSEQATIPRPGAQTGPVTPGS
jgi:DNA-binding transcriptional LysR family regulator